MNMSSLLRAMRDAALDDARAALECARLQHYSSSGPEENAERLSALFDALEECAENHTVLPMVTHAEQVARERHGHGFGLAEVLTAFNVLEEALWRRLADAVTPLDYPEALGLVATVLGAGKQALSLQYVALAKHTGEESVDVEALLGGV